MLLFTARAFFIVWLETNIPEFVFACVVHSVCVCVCIDELELRYKLHSSRDVEVLGSRVTNLADGHLHTVTIRRQADTVSVQVHTHTHTHERTK